MNIQLFGLKHPTKFSKLPTLSRQFHFLVSSLIYSIPSYKQSSPKSIIFSYLANYLLLFKIDLTVSTTLTVRVYEIVGNRWQKVNLDKRCWLLASSYPDFWYFVSYPFKYVWAAYWWHFNASYIVDMVHLLFTHYPRKFLRPL